MLRDSVVVRTRPRAIPLAMITIRKILHGFPFLSHNDYGAPLGGPSGRRSSANKHLMTGPKGNSEFCFPETLNVPRGEAEGNIEVEGKQNSLFLEGPVIKCFVIPSNSNIGKKLRKYDLYERQSHRAVLRKLHHDRSLFLRS